MPPSSKFVGPKLPLGIPQELEAQIKHLSKLLRSLPTALPTDPPDADSTYHFYLDPYDVANEGGLYAFNRRLEVAFETFKLHGKTLVFKEQGKRLAELEAFLRKSIKQNTLPEARNHQVRWIERLITAAQDSGAKIVQKRFVDGLPHFPLRKYPENGLQGTSE